MWRQERKGEDMNTGERALQYNTNKALDIQKTLKHNNNTATLIIVISKYCTSTNIPTNPFHTQNHT